MKTVFLTIVAIKVIVLGFAVLFGGNTPFSEFFIQWWPALIILLGVIPLINHPLKFAWPLFIMGIGSLLLLQQLKVLDAQFLQVALPASLILLGISILASQVLQSRKENVKPYDSIRVFFGENKTKNQSADYRGGSITAIGGAVTLDLSKATIKQAANLKLFVLGSGVILNIPEDWTVKSRASLNFGGVEDIHQPHAKAGPTLILTGEIILGGVKIQRNSNDLVLS